MSKAVINRGHRTRRGAAASGSVRAPSRARVSDDVILDAATEVFAGAGFDRANMEVIAASAGITKPTLYARFGSKEQLFAAAARREYDLRKAALFAAYDAPADPPFHRRLHEWTAAYFDLVRARPAGFRLLSEAERHPASAAIIDSASRDIIDRIARIVTEVSQRPTRHGARIVASMIAGVLTGCAREAVGRRGVDLDKAAQLCESFLYAAVRGVDPDLIAAVG